MGWLGLDVGGANLKVADGLGFGRSRQFELWKHPNCLSDALRALLAECPAADRLAVTMTGEIADCYPTKADGVRAILSATEAAAQGRSMTVYLVDGSFVSPRSARADPQRAAASNWHALAAFCSRFVTAAGGLLIDVGSTTTDLIPLGAGEVNATAWCDPERLIAGELVYTGVRRSPLCALVERIPWRGQQCPVAQELFATTLDAYVTLGDIPEDPADTATADGRARTRSNAHDRLARSICADRMQFHAGDARSAAEAIREAQLAKLMAAVESVVARQPRCLRTVVISGSGEFLARELARRLRERNPVPYPGEKSTRPLEIVSLDEQLSPAVSRCAPAHALAVLARERAVDLPAAS